jgi:hypothetical protein
MSPCVKCGHNPDAQVTARWAFSLDKRITSANTRTVNAGASRWRYAKERDEWQWLVKAALRQFFVSLTTARPTSKRRITITRIYAGRCQAIDRDNLVGGVKALVDAIVREGVVHDDGAEWLELHVQQDRQDCNETHVLVEELA